MYRYYTLYRPPTLGAVPRGFASVVEFDARRYVDEIGREAWGYIEYENPIPPKDVIAYELCAVGKYEQS